MLNVVAQSGITSPVLFSLYVIDMPAHERIKWRIAINVSKSTAMLFAKPVRCIPTPRPVQIFGEPIHWFDNARYLWVTFKTRLS